jgi:hypothetical protein
MLPVMRHPKVAAEPPLKHGRVLLGALGLLIFLLTFTPKPFYDASLMHLLHLEPSQMMRIN